MNTKRKRSEQLKLNNHKNTLPVSKRSKGQPSHPEEENGVEKNSTLSLDPLQMECIVSQILSYLSVHDLKTCRNISTLWAAEGRRILLEKSYLRPKFPKEILEDESTGQIEALLSLTEADNESCTKKLNLKTIDSREVSKLLRIAPSLAGRISMLKFKVPEYYSANGHASTEKLLDTLFKLPNLEILDTEILNLDPNLAYYKQFVRKGTKEEKRSKTKFQALLEKLTSLKEIRLNFTLEGSTFAHYLPHLDKLRGISQVKILYERRTMTPIRIQDLTTCTTYWKNLNSLSWDLDRTVDKNLARQFFLKLSGQLKHLQLLGNMNRPDNSENIPDLEPWEDDWYLPVQMECLEELTIRHGNFATFSVALRLPKLKKLVLFFLENGWSEKVGQWENHPSALGRKLQNLSIVQVDLTHSVPASSSIILTGELWPNVKGLSVCARKFTLFPNKKQLFGHWKNLERLERLELYLPHMSKVSNAYHVWLTGVKYPENYETGMVLVKNSNAGKTICLRHLTNLKSLGICGTNKDDGRIVGDFLIYNSFQFMTNLQSLQFYNPQFSAIGLGYLKRELGNRVSVVCK